MDATRRIFATLGVPPLLALVMFLLGEGISQIVFEALPDGLPHYLWVAGLVAAAAALGWGYDRARRARISAAGQPGTAKLRARRGLIVLIGLDSDDPTGPLAQLLDHTPTLELLALVGTPQTAERGIAERLTTNLLTAWGHPLETANVRVYEHNHAESVADNHHSVADAIRWMTNQGLRPGEIVVDVTKGRRPMGYGAIGAADAAGIEAQYLTWAWDTVCDAPILERQEFKLITELYADQIDTNDATTTPV